MWELPFGKDRKFAAEPEPGARRGPRRMARGRHQHDDERRADQPVLLAGGDVHRSAGSPTYRPNLHGRSHHARQRADDQQLSQQRDGRDPDRSHAAVRQRAAQRRARSDPFHQFDLGLHKNFGLGRDQTRLEARVEAFNLLNKTNFGPANGNRSSSSFGTITSTSVARQIQLGLKFYF